MNEIPPNEPMRSLLARSEPGRLLAEYDGDGYGARDGPGESPLREYWRIFYKRRAVIAAVVVLCVMVGVLLAMFTQREYSATVKIQVSRDSAKVLNIEGLDQSSDPYDQEFYETQYDLLKSRSLAEAVVRDMRLTDNYRFLAGFEPDAVEGVKAIPRAQRFEMATAMVNAGTVVKPVQKSSIINVSYISPNPKMAASVANSIGENFVESNLARRFEATAYARQFLQNRLNQVRSKLEESERKAVAYALEEGLVKIRAGEGAGRSEESLVAKDLTDLSSQLSVARAQRAQAEANYRAGAQGSIAAQSLSNPSADAFNQKRGELIAQLGKLESDFGPEYPAVAALRAQIARLDQQYAAQQGRIRSAVTQDLGGRYRQAAAAERALQAQVDGLKRQQLDEQSRSIQLNIIQRDVDTNRALYEALLQRFKEVGVAGGVGTNNISIIDRALPPKAPFKPSLPFNVVLGLVIGLVLGGLAAFILEQLEEAAVLPADFHRKIGLTLLGATPKLSSLEEVHDALQDRKSGLSEAYFSVLTSIQFSTAHGAPASIMLTSAQAREGKSTTALSLAQNLAGVGARVLLIDADMRNPSLHKALRRPLGSGLSNLLSGHGELHALVQPSQTANLWVLMAGQIPPNPAELLATGVLDRILANATASYDHVIVDGPPILGLADAPLIARVVEATVLVVEAGRTRATQARHAIQRLLTVRANLIGAVLSKLDMRNSGYGYGYGYNYDYGNAPAA